MPLPEFHVESIVEADTAWQSDYQVCPRYQVVLLMFVANVTSCLVPVQGSNSDDQYHHVLERERDARGAERVSVS